MGSLILFYVNGTIFQRMSQTSSCGVGIMFGHQPKSVVRVSIPVQSIVFQSFFKLLYFPRIVGLCQKITLLAESVSCYWNDKQQNCTAALLPGIKVQIKCPSNYKPSFEEITCDTNGEWDHRRVDCVPS